MLLGHRAVQFRSDGKGRELLGLLLLLGGMNIFFSYFSSLATDPTIDKRHTVTAVTLGDGRMGFKNEKFPRESHYCLSY